ncbi:MAG: glycosyltransferase family 2 protein [Deltaproteobacteria bacterium]|nr:glycosyltransferase family 2 protein [Deltaproteobacteria bacterium]
MPVSAVIPTRNRPDLLRRALASVFAQTRPADEVIVACHESERASVEAVAGPWSERIRIVAHGTHGAALARNAAIDAATGKWLAFCDDDDEWMPDRLERLARLADANPDLVAVYSDATVSGGSRGGSRGPTIFSRQSPYAGSIRERLWEDNPIPTSSVLARREVVARLGGFRHRFEPAEDYDLWLRLAAVGPIAFDPKPLCVYHLHGAQTGRLAAVMFPACAAAIEEDLREAGATAGGRVVQRLWSLHIVAAKALARIGDADAADAHWRSAIRLRPWHVGTRFAAWRRNTKGETLAFGRS